MAEESFWCLRHVRVFDGLSERELQELSRISPMRHYRPGQMIYYMGQGANCLYIIGEGEVVISTVTREGKELILGLFQGGDVFGELFASEEDRGKTEAKAHTDVWLCALTERDFLSLCTRRPGYERGPEHKASHLVMTVNYFTVRSNFLKV